MRRRLVRDLSRPPAGWPTHRAVAADVPGLAAHLPACELALVVDDPAQAGAGPLGFLLALAPDAPYASENYTWFAAHRPGSLYVDRIVVAPRAHGSGIGRSLYAAVHRRAHALGLDEVTCEVNLEPPNLV